MDNKEKDIAIKEKKQRQKTFNGLTAKEWASLSRNVWNDVSSPRSKKHIKHGATFPEKLIRRLITMYSNEDELIFDPFLGVGTVLEACNNTHRNGVGIELNNEFFDLAKEDANNFEGNSKIRLINDDCRNLLKHIEKNSVQMMVTSPPYANFIQKSLSDRKKIHKKSIIVQDNNSQISQYSDSTKDFGNLNYSDFLLEISKLMHDLFIVTKNDGYNIWIVKDCRDTKNNIPYVSFHSDIAKIGEKNGFKFHDLIIWDQNEQRRLMVLGYPSVFYSNQNCSFIVILRKHE